MHPVPHPSHRYLNGAKAGGRWVTLRQAVARWPSLVVPALLRIPGWLPAHAAELDDWLVDADGTLLTRQEWDRHPCAEAVCAAEYSRAHTTFLDRHGPEPPCPCERCRGTIHGACEQLRARWAHRFSVCLAEAGGHQWGGREWPTTVVGRYSNGVVLVRWEASSGCRGQCSAPALQLRAKGS